MNLLLLWINGLIFLTCLYGQWQQNAVNWFLICGMIFSAIIITIILGDQE